MPLPRLHEYEPNDITCNFGKFSQTTDSPRLIADAYGIGMEVA